MYTRSIISPLLLNLLLVTGQIQAQSLSSLKSHISKQDFRQAQYECLNIERQITAKLPPETAAEIFAQVRATAGPPHQPPPLEESIKLLEQHLASQNFTEAYRHLLYSSFAVRSLNLRSLPDPATAFTEAKRAAETSPNFSNYLHLARMASAARKYSEALEAIQRAQSLSTPDDPILAQSFDALHALYCLEAQVQAHLGNPAAARDALRKSLQNQNRPFSRNLPDLMAARYFLSTGNADLKNAVIEYLESAKNHFPSTADLLTQWSSGLRSGQNVDLLPPLARLRP